MTSDKPLRIMGIRPRDEPYGLRCARSEGQQWCMHRHGGYRTGAPARCLCRRLVRIFERVSGLIEAYAPDEVALESPFFGENVQSMLKLGRAQGVAMAAALHREVPVFEYAPRRIKQSVTGVGGAAKEQVASMLKSMLGVEYNPKRLDATDGLAVALCHYFVTTSPLQAEGTHPKSGRRGSSGSWEEFVARNPEREIKARRKK